MRVILASSSPRRRELLNMIGLKFEVIPPIGVDEGELSFGEVQDIVVELALKKAMSVALRLSPWEESGIVIGVDTLVELDGLLMGKPSTREEAFKMIEALQGKTHRVFSGVALVKIPGLEVQSGYEVTKVRFSPLSPDEIKSYLDTDEWSDKAGAYAIQGRASLFVEGVEGCFFNVVGLPLSLLRKLMLNFGFDLLSIGGGK